MRSLGEVHELTRRDTLQPSTRQPRVTRRSVAGCSIRLRVVPRTFLGTASYLEHINHNRPLRPPIREIVRRSDEQIVTRLVRPG
jgi:hypothetical protein